MYFARMKYKADISDLDIDGQIELVNLDSINNTAIGTTEFQESLRYEIIRTINNIFNNASITYLGKTNPFTLSLQKNLVDIFFALYEYGKTYLSFGKDGAITEIRQDKGNVLIYDDAYRISNITQKNAVLKSLKMYGAVANAMYSVIDERGVLGVFSPSKEGLKVTQTTGAYEKMKNLFGIKKGQRKFEFFDIPITYSGVTIPVKDLELLENKKDATATVARIFGIQEDMILSGATFDNKENAIIQTYTDYKGLIYGYINQIERQLISFRSVDEYDVKFPSVPQMNKINTNTNG